MKKTALILFCKAPLVGKVKTRLAASLGDEIALGLYKHMLEHLFTLHIPKHLDFFVAYDFEENFIPEHLPRFLQQGATLQERMSHAFLHVWDLGYEKAILFGADVPSIREDDLQQASEALNSHQVCINPSIDGGYYLIGFQKSAFKANLDLVYEQVLACFGKKTVAIGAQKRDIDTIEDLLAFTQDQPHHVVSLALEEYLKKMPKISVIVPIYQEDSKKIYDFKSALMQNAKISHLIEIIVVEAEAKKPLVCTEIIYLKSEDKGRGAQMHFGAKNASGDILLFVHVDTILPLSWDALICDASLKGIEVGAFSLGFDDDGIWFRFLELATRVRLFFTHAPYGDQAHFFSKSLYEKIGGYKNMPLMEDIEIMKRVQKRGCKVDILKAKVITSARRWKQEGLLYTTLRNRVLSTLYALGVSENSLAKFYSFGKKCK